MDGKISMKRLPIYQYIRDIRKGYTEGIYGRDIWKGYTGYTGQEGIYGGYTGDIRDIRDRDIRDRHKLKIEIQINT